MPDEIFGVMAVKNGQKQTIMNLSNARQKSYADLQTMTDAQKKGVIVCPDYPKEEFLVTADEVSYGSGTVKDALDKVNTVEILATATDAYGGVWTLMRCGHTYSLSIYNNNIAGQTMPVGKINCPFNVDLSWLPIYNAVTMSTSQAGHIWNVGVGPTGISGWMYTADASQRFATVTWLK